MSANSASTIQRRLGAATDPVEPPTVRRSSRIKSAKGTCGKAAAHVSHSASPEARSVDDEGLKLGQASIPVTSKKSSEDVDGIIYVTETDLQQYVRVTIQDHMIEDNSVCPLCYRKFSF